ncbi:MAG: ABC transporter permease [Planctomycetota bacterium]
MIRTVLWIGWLSLLRDRVALALTFVLPLVFFTVFASVFGGLDDGGGRSVRVAWHAEESTPVTERLRTSMTERYGLRITPAQAPVPAPADVLRSGAADVVVELPASLSAALATLGAAGAPEVLVHANDANPLAAPIVSGALQAAVLDVVLDALPASVADRVAASAVQVRLVRPLGGAGKKPSIAFFAAGIGVMFLLFSLSGRSAILIEERETGVLERLLASRLSLARLLLGRWLFLALLGCVQISAMFLWAAFAFGLELFTPRHLAGFAVMTAMSAAAAAAFGLFLASLCRSRAQLSGIASVVILVMSALGGSMFPRFLMPEGMQQLGRLTFNAWALDGYQRVFWYEAAPAELWRECAVLGVAGVVFLGLAIAIAGMSARRSH